MTRSKKIFVGLAVVFITSLVALVYDISTKTTFPGSKSRVKDSVRKENHDMKDTVKITLTPKSTAQPL